jgi:hypothetical protein
MGYAGSSDLWAVGCSKVFTLGFTNKIFILNLGVCILLRVLDQVQGFPSNVTLFQ